MRPVTIHIGCSGWNYRHWRGLFYPEGMPMKRWFGFYAEHFDAVEINNSFYRLPSADTFAKWRDQAPPGFRYAVKGNRFVTQAKKLKDCEEPVARVVAPTRSLGETLGPMLWQLPPVMGINLPRLEAFLGWLPSDISHVFEFRHASWYTDEVLALLDSQGAGFVAHDFPGLASPRWACGKAAYVRLHGAAGKYWGRYGDEALLGWADWLGEQARSGRPAWAFFNNDGNADAPQDGLTLKAMVAQLAR